jgi:PAS domain S-box-containing protein
MVTDPAGMILRANQRAGELFGCAVEDLVGEMLPGLVHPGHRPSLRAVMADFALRDPDAEWIGQAVPTADSPFSIALTAAVVRHADLSVYRVR